MSTRALTIAVAAVLVAVGAIVALTSGSDDEGSSSKARETDGAFIVEMIPHHESAIEMAQIALERAQHPEVKKLAGAIVAAQEEEIRDLDSIHQQLFAEPVASAGHGTLGLGIHQMGMGKDMAMLESARSFDRTFIDMMVPHHQGAIRMARIELERGEHSRLMSIARAIVEAQSREIIEMNAWRRDWYGGPSPAGGIPPKEQGVPSHEMMGHG